MFSVIAHCIGFVGFEVAQGWSTLRGVCSSVAGSAPPLASPRSSLACWRATVEQDDMTRHSLT